MLCIRRAHTARKSRLCHPYGQPARRKVVDIESRMVISPTSHLLTHAMGGFPRRVGTPDPGLVAVENEARVVYRHQRPERDWNRVKLNHEPSEHTSVT